MPGKHFPDMRTKIGIRQWNVRRRYRGRYNLYGGGHWMVSTDFLFVIHLALSLMAFAGRFFTSDWHLPSLDELKTKMEQSASGVVMIGTGKNGKNEPCIFTLIRSDEP